MSLNVLAPLPMRLFISHSTGTDDIARARLDAIYTDLSGGDAAYQVFLDRDAIETGDDWRRRIHVALAECDAALMLFTPRALESAWVRKEATILSWRKSLDEKFKLLPVCLDGVTRESFESKEYSPLVLNELQQLASSDARAITDVVRRVLGAPVRVRTVMDWLVTNIAASLKRVDDELLEQACAGLGVSIQWQPGDNRKSALAGLLARRMLEIGIKSLAKVLDVLEVLRWTLDASAVGNIIELLAPFWVEPEAASRIVAAQCRYQGRDLAMNGRYVTQFTADAYVKRAYPLTHRPVVMRVDSIHAGDPAEHVLRAIRETVAKRYGAPLDDSDAALDALLTDSSVPVFVLVCDLPDVAVLEKLRDTYPQVTFVFGTGETLPPAGQLPPNVSRIEPELSCADERSARNSYLQAKDFAKTFAAG